MCLKKKITSRIVSNLISQLKLRKSSFFLPNLILFNHNSLLLPDFYFLRNLWRWSKKTFNKLSKKLLIGISKGEKINQWYFSLVLFKRQFNIAGNVNNICFRKVCKIIFNSIFLKSIGCASSHLIQLKWVLFNYDLYNCSFLFNWKILQWI